MSPRKRAGLSLATRQMQSGPGSATGCVLDRLVEVGDVAGAVGARDVVEGPAQDERQLGAAMAVLRHDAAGGDLQQAEPASAGRGRR